MNAAFARNRASVYALGPGAGLVKPSRPHHYFEVFDRILSHEIDPQRACVTVGRVKAVSPVQKRLDRILERISDSPAGRKLIWWAGARGTTVCLVPNMEEYALYLSGRALIVINDDISVGAQVAFLAHELAHGPQHPMFSDNRYFPIRDQILLRRAREAAAEAWAAVVAWELKEAGFPYAWDEKSLTGYRKILRAFEDAVSRHRDKGEMAVWYGAGAAYHAWFNVRPLVGSYDEQSVNHLARISRDYMGLMAPRQWITHDFLALLGWTGTVNFLELGESGGKLDNAHYRRPLAGHRAHRLAKILKRARETGGWAPPIETALSPHNIDGALRD